MQKNLSNMNINKINTSFGVMLLGIFALSFIMHADAHAAAVDSPFCIGSDAVQNLKPLCLKMVGGAKTWDQAAIYSVNRIIRRANHSLKPLAAIIQAKLLPSLPISKRSQIIDICTNGHADALEKLQDVQKAITNGPFIDVASKLTSAYTAFEDCRDAIVEEKGQPDIIELTLFNKRIQSLIDVALVVAQQDPRIKEYDSKLAKGEFKDSAGDPSLIGTITQNFFGANK